jgi:signal transduction histidine kinase
MVEEQEFVPSSISASLLDGTIRTVDDEFFERSDGSRFPVEYTSTPIIEEGMIVGMVVAFRDITSRRLADERITAMNVELENRVAERTAELEMVNVQKDLLLERERAARAEAERANRVKDEFMAIVSHELRTPLTTIKTFTDLMLRNRVRQDEQIEYLSLISAECDRQISLVQNVLDISYIETRGFSISIESIELVELVQSSLLPHARAAAAAGQELVVDLPTGRCPVRGDAFAVRRIVSNLLENAVKYTPAGGRITLWASQTSQVVRLHVRDTGRGIAESELSKIFDKFYRVGEDTTRTDLDTERGVGLGLYLARLLAGQIGARIEVESRRGEGSIFTLQLEKWESGNGDQHYGNGK